MTAGDIKKAVVIPAYKVSDSIRDVVCSVPVFIDHIIVVDDKCPRNSGKIAESIGNPKVTVIFHEKNRGVGAAVISGYKKAMELGSDIVIKMDGDGQMAPEYLNELIEPLIQNEADYTKGNRFTDFKALRAMPKLRLAGNNILSFMVKSFSGYWNIMDPTNGYTAVHKRVLTKLNLEKIAKRYFFESDMLLNLYFVNAVVSDVPIPTKYGDEESSLSVRQVLIKFPPRLVYGFFKRIFLRYFIYDFNMASVYILLSFPLFLWGTLFGMIEWIDSCINGIPKTAGTIMVTALPLILSFEMLLQAISIDIHSVPRKK